MPAASALIFRSEIDTWLWVLSGLSIAGPAVLLTWLYAWGGAPGLDLLVIAPFLFLAGALVLWIMRSTYYVLEHDSLKIRSGPFSWDVPIKSITLVRSTGDMLSSPALSLQRLEVFYGRGERIMISPENRARFLQELAQRVDRPGVVEAG